MVRGLTAPGKYNDGHGLILHVVTADRRNWLLRYTRAGKERVMGLGSAAVVSLDEAREKAQAARKLLAAGHRPDRQPAAPSRPPPRPSRQPVSPSPRLPRSTSPRMRQAGAIRSTASSGATR